MRRTLLLVPALFLIAAAPPVSLMDQAEALYTGTQGRIDLPQARKLYEKAAAGGDPLAVLRVALHRHLGKCGFPKEPVLADAGNVWALHNLACARKPKSQGMTSGSEIWSQNLRV
jgi:TPR repeat protein